MLFLSILIFCHNLERFKCYLHDFELRCIKIIILISQNSPKMFNGFWRNIRFLIFANTRLVVLRSNEMFAWLQRIKQYITSFDNYKADYQYTKSSYTVIQSSNK